jgi:hypothetical protein
MRRSINIANLIARISLYDFRSYLERSGWSRLSIKNSKWTIFRLESEQQSVEIILPAQEKYSDVFSRISEAINSIGQIENKTAEQVCASIIATNSDSLLIRLEIPNTHVSIPINDAPRHIKAIRNLVLYSACSEVEARPYYETPIPGAETIIEDFNFCHTFQGSFGFEVSSTIAKPLQVDDLFTPPKTRLVIERLARGMQILDEAIKREQPELLISSFKSALNARMCDAITEISLDGAINFNFGVEWASCMPPAKDVRAFHDTLIGDRQVSMLKFVSDQLKIVPPSPDIVQGPVINIHCASNPIENASRRTVALKVKHENYGTIEVKLTLGQDDYLVAISAHTRGKQLSAKGQLQRKGSVWTVEAINSIAIVE